MFERTTQNIEDSPISNSTIIQAGGDVNIDSTLLAAITATNTTTKLLNRLISDKLAECDCCIKQLNNPAANQIINTIFTYGLQGLTPANQDLCHYYNAFFNISSNSAAVSNSCDCISDSNIVNRLLFLLNLSNGDYTNLFERYDSLPNIEQSLTLRLLSSDNQSDCIESLYQRFDAPTADSLKYYYAIIKFNQGNYDESFNLAQSAFKIESNPHYKWIMILSSTFANLQNLSTPDTNYIENLNENIEQLILFKTNHDSIVTAELPLYYITLLQALSNTNAPSIDDYYAQLPPALKGSYEIQCIMGRHHAARQNYDEACTHYEAAATIKTESFIVEQPFQNKMKLEDFSYVINHYPTYKSSYNTPTMLHQYLRSLAHHSPDLYEEKAINSIEEYSNDFVYVAAIIQSTLSPNEAIDEQIFLKIEPKLLDLLQIQNPFVFSFIPILLTHNLESLAKEIIFNFTEFSERDLSKILYPLTNYPNTIKEEIVDYLLAQDILAANVLGAKIDCCYESLKYTSALKYLKTLFSLKPSEATAQSILNLITITGTPKNISNYEPYYSYLAPTQNPAVLLEKAQAQNKLGDFNSARKLAYAALWQLANSDSAIYKQYLSVCFYQIHDEHSHTVELETATDDVAISLYCEAENSLLIVIINKEIEYCTDSNIFNALHLSKDNPLYYKLCNKKLGTAIEHQNKTYVIKEILCKHVYLFRQTLNYYVNNNPDEAFLKPITFNPDLDLKEQLLSQFPETNNEIPLDFYQFKHSPVGIPLDLLSEGNYDKYFNIVEFLLHGEEQVFFAGHNSQAININQPMLITLPTLVVMASFDLLYILNEVSSNIQIPLSLLDFIKERITDSSTSDINSPGSLSIQNGEIYIFERNTCETNYWNKIYETALQFTVLDVSDDERIALTFDNNSFESLIHRIKLHSSWLDSIVLSLRENIPIICDDLFFRRLMGNHNITTCNFTALIGSSSIDKVPEQLKTISKSNYLYCPILSIDEEDKRIIIENIFNSKIKTKFYSAFFKPIFEAIVERINHTLTPP